MSAAGDAAALAVGFGVSHYLRRRTERNAGAPGAGAGCPVHGGMTFEAVPADTLARTAAAAEVLKDYDLVVVTGDDG